MTAELERSVDQGLEQAGLWRALKAGDRLARNRLFAEHVGFANQIAMRHFRRARAGSIELQELRQLASVGLLEAIDRFDPERGAPFRAYAARRITGSVLDGLAHASELREQTTFRNRVRSERARSLRTAGAVAETGDELLQALVELATGLAIGFLLESGMMASEATPDRGPTAYDSLAWRETVTSLRQALDRLPEREQLIIRHHYLEGVAFETIAELLGLSKGRISQLHSRAIIGLRQMMTSSKFTLSR